MKTCCRCGCAKPKEEFHKVGIGKIGGRCKSCEAKRIKEWASKHREKLRLRYLEWRKTHPEASRAHSRKQYEKNRHRYAAHVMNRLARKANATPPWAEKEKIALLYKKAREWGMHVDHIVPLRHPLVCGLHVWHNLQLLAPEVNMSKRNTYWPDMPEAN